MFLWLLLGRWIDVSAEIERNRRFGDADSPALVPRVIGQGVVAFDVGDNGQLFIAMVVLYLECALAVLPSG